MQLADARQYLGHVFLLMIDHHELSFVRDPELLSEALSTMLVTFEVTLNPKPLNQLGAPLPHLHRDWAHRCHICAGTGLGPATSAPGPGAPRPHLRRG